MTRPHPRSFCRWVLAVMAATAGANRATAQLPADARFAYELFAPGGSVPLTGTYAVAASTPFTLQVYLRQVAGSTDVLAAEGGLFGGGVRVTYGSPVGTPGVVRVAGVNDVQYNPAFNDTATSNPSRVATTDYAEFRAVTDGTTGVPAIGGRVYLGQFNFQVQGAAGSTTQIRAADAPVLSDSVTYNNLYILDRFLDPADLAVLVVPVPEPFAGVAFATAVLGARAVGRRRRASGCPPPSPEPPGCWPS